MQKERISCTLSPTIVDRIDRLAGLRGHSRSKMMELLLEMSVEEEERTLKNLASPIIGPIVQAVLDHPKLAASLAKVIGDNMNPEEVARWSKAGPKIRQTRERLRDERGRRYDLEAEGA